MMRSCLMFFALVFTPVCLLSQTAPGGVSSGLELWIKAGEGVLNAGAPATDGEQVDTWEDNSGARTNDLSSASTALSSPVFLNNSDDNINFNPSIAFDGVDTGLNLADDYIFSSGNGMTFFGAVWPDDNTDKNRQYLLDFGFAGNMGYGFAYGSESIFNYTALDFGGAGSEHLHNKGSIPAVARLNVLFSDNQSLYVDGLNVTSNAITLPALSTTEIWQSPTHQHNNGPFTIGRQAKNDGLAWEGGRAYDGKMGEVIAYSEALSATDALKVDSYLAIKYGITLGSTASPLDYLSSDETVIWTGSGTYQNGVAGIGRDDNSALEQKQSKSIAADAIVTMGLDDIAATNAQNPGSFSADQSFLVWGNNNGDLSSAGVTDTGTTTNGVSIQKRLDRTWRAEATGSPGTVKIRFDMGDIPGPGGTAGANDLEDVRLLVDDDGIFASGATAISPTAFDNSTNIVEFDHDFSSGPGSFFTIGSVDSLSAPLPVDLLYFDVDCGENPGEIQFSWATTMEKNNDFFTIEGSQELNHFKPVKTIDGAGNSDNKIRYTTTINESSATRYYRLKQTDYDGTTSYSRVIANTCQQDTPALQVYPNPAQDVLTLEGQLSGEKLHVTNTHGVVTYTKTLNDSSDNKWTIDVSDWDSGMYFIRVGNASRKVLVR